MKRTPLLWLHNKLHLAQQEKIYESEMVWYFIGVSIINRTLHDHLEIPYFLSCVKKYFTRSLLLPVKYFLTLEEKFCISMRPCNILYTLNEFWKTYT